MVRALGEDSQLASTLAAPDVALWCSLVKTMWAALAPLVIDG